MDPKPERDMDERTSIDMPFDDALSALLSEEDDDDRSDPDQDEGE